MLAIFAALAACSPCPRVVVRSIQGGDTNLKAIAARGDLSNIAFGGRRSALSALLGLVVIKAISSVVTLVCLNSWRRSIITGVALVLT